MADADLSRPSGAATGPRDDWPAQAADTIVKVVGTVRDRTTGPAITASRAVVYGTLAAILGTTALILFCIVAVRAVVLGADALLDVFDVERAGRANWIAHLIVGAAMSVGGLWIWRKAWSLPGN